MKFKKSVSFAILLCVFCALFFTPGNVAMADGATKIIKVPYINQCDIVYGCEAVSATMVLQHYGYDISEKDFTDNYLIKRDWHIEPDGRRYGPDPNAAYPGNPYIEEGVNCGFGSFTSSTAKSMNKVLNPLKHEAKAMKGKKIDSLIKEFIDNDIPVLIWATMDMKPSRPGRSWIIDYTDENSPFQIGDTFVWTAGEHCLVLIGYDDANYYFNDPYKNHGLIAYEKGLVNARYEELGEQSAVVLEKPIICSDMPEVLDQKGQPTIGELEESDTEDQPVAEEWKANDLKKQPVAKHIGEQVTTDIDATNLSAKAQ